MRLFVALDLPQEVASYVTEVQSQLKREIRADRWQPTQNLHLTLHFLGEVKEELLPAIRQDMDMVSQIISPFWLSTGYLGAFPNAEKPRVLWMGLHGGVDALKQLHLLLGKRFQLHHGLHFDRKPYRPHITMARGPHTNGSPLPLEEWGHRIHTNSGPRFEVNKVHLYHSELRPQGAIHTVIHTSSFSLVQSAT